ncbi:PREDICTED: integrin alpha-8-like [Polistes canadensis]|uniref:integrin alpha-8-like n=1 Tax=Polistes canadensis TaxID=91411 RepID=UPI000718C3B3|nr:PREDICTED: integrin alpha-8-like [Polistes canadensis]
MLLCGFLFKIFLSNTLAYNLDITNVIKFVIPQKLKDTRSSYFGYSTALYNNGKNVSGVLIGAPRANTSDLPSILEPGTVYMCLFNNVCKEWVVDKSENEFYENRNNSWIGAVVMTGNNGINSKVLVCAPRLIKKCGIEWYITGMCYWTTATSLKSFEKESEKISVDGDYVKLHNYLKREYIYHFGMGQVGFSADISFDKSEWNVALGGPGLFHWKGAAVYFTESTSGFKQTITANNKLDSYDYLGYSTTSGFYFSKTERLFASGSPRGNDMKGCVIVYSFSKHSEEDINISNTLNGYQCGEYFGATLASCDLNNDGRDDLIVGAPFWTRDMDEGRVYIFIAWENNNFIKGLEIEGDVSGGRFGSSITCLGDIDYDGYNDIIIGAPYEGNSGAIYLYNSDKNGNLKCSQKIVGSEFSPNVRGFGISVSKPLDINGDKYLDIAVGAYLSEQVFLLTSIPVVSIAINLVYPDKSLSRDSKFFTINICTSYKGVHAPMELNITRYLEIDLLYERAVYLKNEKTYFTCTLPTALKISERQCDSLKIHLKNNIQNVIDPITLSVVVDINNNTQEVNKSSNIVHRSSAVINKLNSKIKDVIQLPFMLECGTDDICNSDLRISLRTNLKSNNTYIIGSASDLKLIINVHNNGEPAYQTQVHIYIPNPLLLASIPTACLESARTNEDVLHVICKIGNPLTNENNKTIVLELDTSKVRFDVKSLELFANVSTQSKEINEIKKNYTMTIYFDIDVDIAIAGKAPDNVYSYSQEDEGSLQNIQFKHIYEVQKFGQSPINEAALTIEIPTLLKSTDYDIELISINQTSAHMDGNILNLKINDMDDSKDFQTNIKFLGDGQFDVNNTSIITSPGNSLKKTTNASLENRVLFINCSNQQIVCKRIECKLNPFTSSLSVAQLIITLDFKVSNILSSFLKEKNIILFASKGRVNITQPPNVIQGSTNKPDSTIIITKFQGSPINERVAVWIIVLSIFLGIVFFILIHLVLIKLGFYQRKKKEQLEALKAMSDSKTPTVLETTSSELVDPDRVSE